MKFRNSDLENVPMIQRKKEKHQYSIIMKLYLITMKLSLLVQKKGLDWIVTNSYELWNWAESELSKFH